MAKLYITEFRQQGKAANEAVPGSLEVPATARHCVEFEEGEPAKLSQPFDGATELVHLASTAPCFISFGVEPVAEKDLFPLTGSRDLFSVPKGQGFRVAVIHGWGNL